MTKTPLNPVEKAANDLVATILDDLPSHHITAATVRSLARAAVVAAVKRGGINAEPDKRSKKWRLKAQVLVMHISAATSAATWHTIATAETECIGFDRAATWLRDGVVYAFGPDLPEGTGAFAILTKLDKLRPVISRGDGHATLRLRFTAPDGRHAMIRADVERVL